LSAERILVVKRDKIGDMLLTTPLLAVLRKARPQAHIDVLGTDYNGWVLEGNHTIDRCIRLPRVRVGKTVRWANVARNAAMRAQVALSRYDAVIVAQGDESERAVRRAFLTRSSRVVAYCTDAKRYGRRLTDPLPPPPDDVHEIERMIALVRPLGITPPNPSPHPEYTLPQRAEQFARQWLQERRLERGGYVVLGLGARRASRQPSAPQVARWSTWWRDRLGLATVFVWTPGKSDNPMYPGDDEIAEPVLAMNLPHVHPYRGPILETLGLIWQARTSVFPDSGLMHFAAASPGGVLGLFARASLGPLASRWSPRGVRAHWVVAASDIPSEPDDAFLPTLQGLLAERATAASAYA
jgi:ADP-heptose:LPS heptosyltransferase